MRIQLLDPLLANQIAAGEVIERPASVVKELLENSLDAGAQKIEIDIQKGGMQIIRIRDDGSGIDKADVALALQRHATSKISSLDDLEKVQSLGFRGEALASIAAVARVQLQSCVADETHAWQVSCEGSESSSELVPVSHPQGTTIEVRDLFFNTPARRRFLRTEKTEFDHINDLFKRVALSRFDIAFILRHNQRVVHQLRAANTDAARDQRVAKICGSQFIDNAVSIDMQSAGLRIWGWLGLPSFARNQADGQYFYVNGRMIKDRLINHALRQAYADQLYPGKYASYVLYLELDPSTVDVNVHPTKHEVRFHDSRLVHDFLQRSLQDALQQPVIATSDERVEPEVVAVESTVTTTDPRDTQPRAATVSVAPTTQQDKAPLFPQRPVAPRVDQQMAVYQALHTGKNSGAFSKRAHEKLSGPLGRSLRQVEGKFLLAENQQGLLLVDLHVAWQAVTLQRWQQALTSEGIRRQPLLVPLSMSVTEAQADVVENKQTLLQRLGINIQCTGPEAIMVRQIPSLLADTDVTQWLSLLLDKLGDFSVGIDDEQLTQLLTFMCEQAVHVATKQLDLAALDNLLREIEALGDGAANSYCELTAAKLAQVFST